MEFELELAKKAAIHAARLLRDKDSCKIDSEVGKDIKLSSDKNSERIIIDILAESPYSILSEEQGLIKRESSDYIWIIDPLDGSANYWRGLEELSCISIALWKEDEPVFGLVYRFNEEDMYIGIVGEGAFKNEGSIYTSDVEVVEKAILATGFPVNRDYSSASLEKYIRQVQQFKKIRMLGTAATMGTLVAEGCFDVYVEEEIMLWDIAAAAALVKAAGGDIEIKRLDNDKCICKLFANEKLRRDYYAKGI